ncbi:hypothetical protein K1719_021329 [Acacia pycnantha]|nr:hypothetical protein K1719_021329 [Acacia pycnantha]
MCLQEQHSSGIPVILALGSELDRACNKIDQMIQEQSSNQNDIEFLINRFAEEKAAWKRRERQKVTDIQCFLPQFRNLVRSIYYEDGYHSLHNINTRYRVG